MAVLQYCAADDDQHNIFIQHDVFNADRAHSRLHRAAVAALSNITTVVPQQQKLDGVILYLERYGEHVKSFELRGDLVWGTAGSEVVLRQLPPKVQLSSLQLSWCWLQLQPGDGFQGVLGSAAAVAALKQLRLIYCKLLDDEDGLADAVSQLPAGLEHLSISSLPPEEVFEQLPSAVLQHLQVCAWGVRRGCNCHCLSLPACMLAAVLDGLEANGRVPMMSQDTREY